MTRKTRRRLLRLLSRVPGLYSLLAFTFVRRATVRGWSMAPTLLPGELLLFDRLAYMRNRPKKGDVVLLNHPLQPELRLVKRIAAVSGETMDGHTLARGELWLLGDNPDLSSDSRNFGPAKREDLLGRAWILYWPTNRWRVFD